MSKIQNIIFKNNISSKLVKNKKLHKENLFLIKEINKIFKELKKIKNTFFSLSNNFRLSNKFKDLRKFKKFKTVAIFGMGGSILGAKAIYSFLGKKDKQFFFYDNLDQYKISKTQKKNNLKNALFVIISKSGNTLETLVNINFLKKNIINKSNTIIITENEKNYLNIFAKKNKILSLDHKKYIGGRYSVLTEVGMVPAYLMGHNVNNFRKNLLLHFKSKRKNFLKKSILELKQIYLSKKYHSIIFFNYCPRLNDFLYWCQQLIAESLGKKGRGLLPVISSAPKDHHSLLQLYLDGPKDKLFYIFSSSESVTKKLQHNKFDKNLDYLRNKKVNDIIISQKNAFIKLLQRKKIPYREIIIKKFDPSTLGELFSYFFLETSLLGKALKINPFNQPAVEDVKDLTKKFLV